MSLLAGIEMVWGCSSAGEHFVDIEGVTGSIPVTPTIYQVRVINYLTCYTRWSRFLCFWNLVTNFVTRCFTKGQPIQPQKFVLRILLVSLSSVFFHFICFAHCRVNSLIFKESGFDGDLAFSWLNSKSAMTVDFCSRLQLASFSHARWFARVILDLAIRCLASLERCLLFCSPYNQQMHLAARLPWNFLP